MKIVATIMLAGNHSSWYDPITKIHLNYADEIAEITSDMDFTNIRTALKKKVIILASGEIPKISVGDTTGSVTVNGERYESINSNITLPDYPIVEVDKAYVDKKIQDAAIDGSGIDLIDYAKKEYVDEIAKSLNINSDLSEIFNINSLNLYTAKNDTIGILQNTGAINEGEGLATDFIEIDAETTYYVPAKYVMTAFYDKSKTFISAKNCFATITAPQNSCYVRCNVTKDAPFFVAKTNEYFAANQKEIILTDAFKYNLKKFIQDESSDLIRINSITPSQVSFLKDIKNILDPATLLTNTNLTSVGLTESVGYNSTTTDFIPVKDGDVLTTNINKIVCLYNEDKVFYERIVTGLQPTQPYTLRLKEYKGIKYVRFAGYNANPMIVKGEILPSTPVEYNSSEFAISDNRIVYAIESIAQNKVQEEISNIDYNEEIKDLSPYSTNFFTQVELNLINKENLVKGYINPSGNLQQYSETIKATDFFMPKPNTKYYFNFTNWGYGFYDVDKKFISGSRDNTIKELTTPQDVVYMRISLETNNIANPILSEKPITNQETTYGEHLLNFKKDKFADDIFEQMANNEAMNTVISQIVADKIATLGGYSNLKGEKWAVFGDSISATAYASKPYSSVIAEDTGCTVINKALSGWRIMRTGANCILDKVNDLTGSETIVTLAGGYNDKIDFVEGTMEDRIDTTFYGAYHLTLLKILEKCPTARIATFTLFPNGNRGEATIERINEIIREVSAYYSIPCLDMWTMAGLPVHLQYFRENFTLNDALHLNNEGHKLISKKIRSFLESL